jgi:hypothetical protein
MNPRENQTSMAKKCKGCSATCVQSYDDDENTELLLQRNLSRATVFLVFEARRMAGVMAHME